MQKEILIIQGGKAFSVSVYTRRFAILFPGSFITPHSLFGWEMRDPGNAVERVVHFFQFVHWFGYPLREWWMSHSVFPLSPYLNILFPLMMSVLGLIMVGGRAEETGLLKWIQAHFRCDPSDESRCNLVNFATCSHNKRFQSWMIEFRRFQLIIWPRLKTRFEKPVQGWHKYISQYVKCFLIWYVSINCFPWIFDCKVGRIFHVM